MLPALLMLLDWAAGEAAVAIDGRGLNLTAIDNQPRYKTTDTQARYDTRDNQPLFKAIT